MDGSNGKVWWPWTDLWQWSPKEANLRTKIIALTLSTANSKHVHETYKSLAGVLTLHLPPYLGDAVKQRNFKKIMPKNLIRGKFYVHRPY